MSDKWRRLWIGVIAWAAALLYVPLCIIAWIIVALLIDGWPSWW